MMKEWFIDADSVSHVSKMIKTNFQILVQMWLIKLVLQGGEAIRTCHGSIDLDDPFWIKRYLFVRPAQAKRAWTNECTNKQTRILWTLGAIFFALWKHFWLQPTLRMFWHNNINMTTNVGKNKIFQTCIVSVFDLVSDLLNVDSTSLKISNCNVFISTLKH